MLYTQNRELSWLRFNDRVLSEAADPAVPLLERLKFISIFNSNLDEFFMLRADSFESSCREADGGACHGIYETISHMYRRCADVYDAVADALRPRKVEIVRADALDASDARYAALYFERNILPLLSPQIIDLHHPFPNIRGRAIYCAALVRSGGEEHFALIPSVNVPPLVYLPGEGVRATPTNEIIMANMGAVFQGLQCRDRALIAVTRSADIKIGGASERCDRLTSCMEQALKKRRTMAPVRLELGGDIGDRFMEYLRQYFHLTERQIYSRDYPMDMSLAYHIADRMAESNGALFYPPPPVRSPFRGSALELVGRGDVLLSYPYDSMDVFLSLLMECAEDDNVLSIRITIYRLDKCSRLAEYLCRAAKNGKEVTAVIELRARFDEERNILWARRLEDAGCHVLYGTEGWKVHSKICLITRRENGGIGYITQIGTGNYNEKTARLYTDLCLITAARDIGEDGDRFFKSIGMGVMAGAYSALLASPAALKKRIISLIAAEAKKGSGGRIIMKLNSISDGDVIKSLRDASAAGVRIDLIVRGICCILPGIAGETENITVRSIVGRFLEHSRIYVFGKGEDAEMYISSADMMKRNTEQRVEIACPVRCAEARRRIEEILSLCLKDSVKARLLTPKGEYVKICSEEQVDCQRTLMYGGDPPSSPNGE
jgi:polyphosphate kinase